MKKFNFFPTDFSRRIFLAYCLAALLFAGYIFLHLPYTIYGQGATTSIPVSYDVYAILAIITIVALAIGRFKITRWSLSIGTALVLLGYFITSGSILIRMGPGWRIDETVINPYAVVFHSPVLNTSNFTFRGLIFSILNSAGLFREIAWWWFIVPIVDAKHFPLFPWQYSIAFIIIFSGGIVILACAEAVIALWLQDAWMPVRNELSDKFRKYFAVKFPSLRGRWLTRLHLGLWCSVLIFLVLAVLAQLQNTHDSRVIQQQRIFGPDAPPFVYSILPISTRSVFLGTSAGIFHSNDGGRSWQPISNGLLNTTVEAMVRDAHTGVLYAGTNTQGLTSTSKGGIFRSENEGQSWQVISTGLANTDIWTLAIDNDGVLYAGTNDGIYRSENEGKSWQAIDIGSANRDTRSLIMDDAGILYAGTNGSGVFRSEDQGESWQAVNTRLSAYDIWTLAMDSDGVLYAGTSGGVFRLEIRTQSWRAINTGLSDRDVWKLTIDSEGALYAATIGGGVFRSENEGQSWQAVNTGLSSMDVRSLAVDSAGVLYAGTNGTGIFRSENEGESWQATNKGLLNIYIWALTTDTAGGLYAGTNGGGVFRSENQGQNWQAINTGLSNTDIRSLAYDPDGILYAGTNGGGAFRSENEGQSWQEISTGLSSKHVWALAIDSAGVLYAGTSGGVFRSEDKGQSWQEIGLPTSDIWGLAIDATGELYAGASGGVYRSDDEGQNWQEISDGLSNRNVSALAIDNSGTVYVATIGGGIFRLADEGQSWQEINNELPNKDIRVLTVDNQDVLYTGTSGGVFRSENKGENWQPINTELSNTNIWTLTTDDTGILYAGTFGGGVFRLEDETQSWQAINAGLSSIDIRSLVVDNEEVFYAGIYSGIYRSADKGKNWQAINSGLSNIDIKALAIDSTGAIYVGTSSGIFRSENEGQSWQAINTGLSNNTVIRALVIDNAGVLYAGTYGGGVLRSENGGQTWQATNGELLNPYIWSLAMDSNKNVLYAETSDGVFRSKNGGRTWRKIWVSSISELQFLPSPTNSHIFFSGELLQIVSSSHLDTWSAWGSVILHNRRQSASHLYLPVWYSFKVLIWWLVVLVRKNLALLVGVALASIVIILSWLLASTYTNIIQVYKIPAWALLTKRQQVQTYTDSTALDSVWMQWEQTIRRELIRYGDVISNDILDIPWPFRRYSINRYADLHSKFEFLDIKQDHLRLLVGNRLNQWHSAWRLAGQDMGAHAGLTAQGRSAVDTMATALAEALGLTLGRGRDFGPVRAYIVEAPALRLNIPLRFPLLFLAEPQPSSTTVQALVDVVDVLKESGYFSLLVPLEPSTRRLDIPAEIRRTIDHSPHVQDFIVLSQEDVLTLLIARDPGPRLAQMILRQRDLTLVSPFVINGPVPETMFFGREAQVKKLVESAGMADFAIVGNRKIGKTSLLQRSRAKMELVKQVVPLMLDCQTVRDASSFYTAFEGQTKVELPSPSPEGFATAITQLQKENGCPIVLFIDEVDALLLSEQEHGNRLTATWRQLAMAGLCRFILCGSTGLAKCLNDPHSPFFNFPQPMPLGYLLPETAKLVLTQPMEVLGMILENEEELIDGVLALTSGHPNLIQYVGQLLVQATNERKERQIGLADLENVRQNNEFIDYFLKTIWGEAGPLEKLITLVAPESGFDVAELEERIIQVGVTLPPEDLDEALRILGYYAIFERRGKRYYFLPGAFSKILHETQEVERLISQERKKLLH